MLGQVTILLPLELTGWEKQFLVRVANDGAGQKPKKFKKKVVRGGFAPTF